MEKRLVCNAQTGEVTEEFFEYTPPTREEKLAAIRVERNARLAACDWTQLSDVPATTIDKAAWAAYRQALRDFPATCDPDNPVWPVPPT